MNYKTMIYPLSDSSLLKRCLLLLILVLQLTSMSAQDYRVNLQYKNATFGTVLNAIGKQTSLSVVYNSADAQPGRLVSINAKNENIHSVMKKLLTGTNLSYTIEKKHLIISKKQSSQKEKKVTVRGSVKDANGEPLIGVSIRDKDGNNGTITDMDGNYTLNTNQNSTLEFSYIGYSTISRTATNDGSISVVLSEDSKQLDEVVVTALGIKRSEKALSYNVQQIKSESITTAKDPNFVNSLSGKVAGVEFSKSSSGVGGATKVVMRGTKSLVGNNNVLYVIDGMPIGNPSRGSTSSDYITPVGGESISDFNPEDIESISVMTGPSAAALYGAAAANGVILINTKKGQEGKMKVSYSNTTEFMSAYIMPEFQNAYGNKNGSYKSWGDKLENPSSFNPRDFFKTGSNVMNSVTITTGTQNNQTFLSAATTNSNGIIPNNKYNRYNFTLRNTAKMMDDKLSLDLGASYVMQSDQNMLAGGLYFNPLLPLYLFPRGDDFEPVTIWERYDKERKIPVQNWNYGDQGMSLENPYWIVNREMFMTQKKRYMFYANAKYDITKWLNVSARVRIDHTSSTIERKYHASTILLQAQSDKGFYQISDEDYRQTYGDIMLNLNKSFNQFNLTANVGSSYEDYHTTGLGVGGKLFTVPNLFSANNLDPSGGPGSQKYARTRNIGIFASAELGYKSMLYLTLTGRTDWPSQLVNSKEPSIFYPSIGLSGVITEMAKLPEFISFWKVRTSYTEVGSPITQTGITPGTITDSMSGGVINPISTYPYPELKAERTKSYEIGTNLRLWDNRINIDATYYHSNTYNQTFLSNLPASSGYSGFYVQAGNVRNSGIELALGYSDTFGKVNYSTNLTYTRNTNKILEMVHNYKNPIDGSTVNITELESPTYLREGGSMGDVYVQGILARDKNGNLIEENSGYKVDRSQRIYAGSRNPKFSMGWRHEISWNRLTLSCLFNARIGGVVTSTTQAYLDDYGVSMDSYQARENGGVWIDGQQYDAEKYYTTIGGERLGAYYIYKATNIRLQELSLSYSLPKAWFHNVIQKCAVSFIGRNLWMLYNQAPFDPELSSSTGTYSRGDCFTPPSLRNLGFSVKIEL